MPTVYGGRVPTVEIDDMGCIHCWVNLTKLPIQFLNPITLKKKTGPNVEATILIPMHMNTTRLNSLTEKLVHLERTAATTRCIPAPFRCTLPTVRIQTLRLPLTKQDED
jgi:hypothetical protein